MGMLQNSQKFRCVLQNSLMFRVLRPGRNELTEVPGTYINAVPVPQVSVARVHRAYGIHGYGY